MLVCHCKALSDREIRTAIRGGAQNHRAVARETGAGKECGGCCGCIRDLLDEEQTRDRAAVVPS